MIGFIPENIIVEHNSIPLEDISQFNRLDSYVKGSYRIYNDIIYKALQNIKAMTRYTWYNEDSNNNYGYDNLNQKIVPDPTNVYIENGVTVVYVQSNLKYYIAKSTGYIDFTIEDPITPANFDSLGTDTDYRFEEILPNGKKNTLNWGYEGSTNQTVMFDGVINKQSENNRSISRTDISFDSATNTISSTTKITNIFNNDKILVKNSYFNNGEYTVDTVSVDKLSFTIKEIGTLTDESSGANINIYTYSYVKFTDSGIDKIAIFNTICEVIEIKTTVETIETIYTIDMIDTDNIIDFETFVFEDTLQLKKIIQTIPRDLGVEFEITFKGLSQYIGELIIGKSFDLGKAEDTANLDSNSYNTVVEANNGDVYFDEEDLSRVVTKTAYTVVVPTNEMESMFGQNNKLINKRLVINGSNKDKGDIKYLISYGFGRSYKFTPKTTHELSTYKFEFRSIL